MTILFIFSKNEILLISHAAFNYFTFNNDI